MRLNELMDVLHPWRILLGISAHLHPFSHFQRMTHLPQQIPLDVKFWTCQHIPSSFQIPQEKDTCSGVPYLNLPLYFLSFLLSPLTHLDLSTPITSLLFLWFLFFYLWLWLYLYILGMLLPIASPLLPSYSVSISIPTIPISPWSVFFFLHLPFLSSHCCHHTEMPPTLSTSICTGLLKWVSLFTCKFLL